jgi:hypothetical protein
MPLSFTPLLRLKRCHVCDQWHFLSGVHFLPVDNLNSVQTLKVEQKMQEPTDANEWYSAEEGGYLHADALCSKDLGVGCHVF